MHANGCTKHSMSMQVDVKLNKHACMPAQCKNYISPSQPAFLSNGWMKQVDAFNEVDGKLNGHAYQDNIKLLMYFACRKLLR
jgi:hypothetical protein